LAADPTVLAPFAAVPLTVPPTDPIVLRPFRERLVDRARAVRDEDRVPDEPREPEVLRAFVRVPDELRELEVLRALVLRAFEAVFFRVLPAPFPDLERLEVLRRRLVLVLACAIYSSVSKLSTPGFHSGAIWGYPPTATGNRRKMGG
jgi:hypothetical protein